MILLLMVAVAPAIAGSVDIEQLPGVEVQVNSSQTCVTDPLSGECVYDIPAVIGAGSGGGFNGAKIRWFASQLQEPGTGEPLGNPSVTLTPFNGVHEGHSWFFTAEGLYDLRQAIDNALVWLEGQGATFQGPLDGCGTPFDCPVCECEYVVTNYFTNSGYCQPVD